jgi:hypothetical protein
MREGVHRVNAPCIASVVVRCPSNAVNGRVAQVDVGRCHVNFGAKDSAPSDSLPSRISRKRFKFSSGVRERKGLFLPGVLKSPRWARMSSADCSSTYAKFCLYEEFGSPVHEVEIIAGLVQMRSAMSIPIETQPCHCIQNRVDVFGVFFFPDWYRQSACGRRPHNLAPSQSSGKCFWHGRRANSHWARAENVCEFWRGRESRRHDAKHHPESLPICAARKFLESDRTQ